MATIFKIEKGVDLPLALTREAYPFGEMTVGDSFFYGTDAGNANQVRERLATAASRYGIRNAKRFSVGKVDGGYRVWRRS